MASRHQRTRYITIASGILFLFLAVATVYGGWITPNTTTYPDPNVPGPLTVDSLGEIKEGGIQLNTYTTSNWGLIVYGSDTTGFVGIGTNSGAPTDRLDLAGNLKLSGVPGDAFVRGLIKPQLSSQPLGTSNAGSPNQALTTVSGNAIDWTDTYAWMNIQSIDIALPGSGCIRIFPLCPPGSPSQGIPGWQEYSVQTFEPKCTPGPNNSMYGNEVRTCFQPLP